MKNNIMSNIEDDAYYIIEVVYERREDMPILNRRKCYTTGALVRDKDTTIIRITWQNFENSSQYAQYKLIDWTNGTPTLLKQEVIYLHIDEVKTSDIKIFAKAYSNNLNVKLYEVRLDLLSDNEIISNIYGLNEAGMIVPTNTVLYNQLLPLGIRLCASNF